LKRWIHWKIIFSVTILLLFSALFIVLYIDMMKLPDTGFSRGIELIRFEITGDYEDYYSKNTFIIPDHDTFLLTYADSSSVTTMKIDGSGVPLNTLKLNSSVYIQSINGHRSDDHDIINLFFKDRNQLIFEQSFSLKTGEPLKDAALIINNPRKSHLGSDHLLYANDNAIYLYYKGQHFEISKAKYIETLTSNHVDNLWYITFTYYDQNAYRQKLVVLDEFMKPMKEVELQKYIGSNSMIPSEIALYIHQNRYYSTTVFKDQKSGTNYVYMFDGPLDSSEQFDMTKFTSKNYSLFPTYYLQNNRVMIAFSFDTSIGRVDIQTSGGQFTNLVASEVNNMSFNALTNTIHPSIKPIFFELMSDPSLKKNQYLVFSEISKGESTLYLSSNHPDLIEKSLNINSREIMNLLMTTLTTFLPLSYVGLILEVYILMPILILVLIASMFYINWAERNGNKLLKVSILLHIIAKLIFVNSKIIGQTEKFENFPFFIDTPVEVFGWGIVLTTIALYCFLDFSKRNKGTHYMKSYIFFNVIDLIFFVMLYTPYLFLS
jgi:hypothetical protein